MPTIGDAHSLTRGWVQRHIPGGSGIDLDIAVLDLAQDFLLAHLREHGIVGDVAVFKGGTALRKLYAGSQGRFSTDLDLATVEIGSDRDAVADLVAEAAEVKLGPFNFEPELHRGRWQIGVRSPWANPNIRIKIDIGPPCWLEPTRLAFVQSPIHGRYGFDLPDLPCMRLEEMLAEKIARLIRRATARDAWDLVWVATTSPHSRFSRSLVRQLAALKVWVDNHGLGPDWSRALNPAPFDTDSWLSPRTDWDDEQIGLLATPTPTLAALEGEMIGLYSWLADLTDEEARFSAADPADRGEVLHALERITQGRMAHGRLW